MKNPLKRFIKTQEEEARRIRQSENVVSEAMRTLLKESTPVNESGEK